MIKNSFKKAFTIAEAIITFTLMGAIFVVTVSNIDFTPKENYNKLYWQAFNTLYQASKSYKQEWDNGVVTRCQELCKEDNDANVADKPNCRNYCATNVNRLPCYKADCWRNSNVTSECVGCQGQEKEFPGGTKNIDRAFPGFLYNYDMNSALVGRGQDREFCKKLVSKINTHPAGRCESFISVVNPENIKNDKSNVGVVFSKAFAFCNEEENDNYEDDSSGEKKSEEGCKIVNNKNGISPSFVALNGQKFYISSVVTANSPSALGSNWNNYKNDARESYRFVVVDINGDSKPNSQFRTGTRNPDIVLFAINSEGDVIPLGLPEFSQTYINAVVYYPNDLDEEGNRVYTNIKSDIMSLWLAKKHAWGGDKDDKQGTTHPCGSGLPYLSGVSRKEPMSQSSKFYAVAVNCKDNVAACAKKCKKDASGCIKSCNNNQQCIEACNAKGTFCKTNEDVEEGGIYADKLFTHIVMQFLYKAEGSGELYSDLTKSDGVCLHASAENGCETVQSLDADPPCAIDFVH